VKKIGTLDSSVKLIVVTFNFNSWRWVPKALPQRETEGMFASAKRRIAENAKSAILCEPTEGVCVRTLAEIDKSAGYKLVSAWVQARYRHRKPVYPSVRFVFARSDHATISEEFTAKREEYLTALREMTTNVLWRVRAFRNPFHKNRHEVPGIRTFQINLESRTPLSRPDGTPITIWQKDENGERVGSTPVPLQSKFELRIEKEIVQLISV
jgi:hypothetical protein